MREQSMRWRVGSRGVLACVTMSAVTCCGLAFWAAAPVAAGTQSARSAAGAASTHAVRRASAVPGTTNVTVNGADTGQTFNGIGAISGGGGMSRLLIDYPPAQQNQILNYLFGPGGADLQVLKLEIGGDAGQADGSEPSVEHIAGQTDCDSGYEWWLAEQAIARNPQIVLMGLQWAAPGWVGSIWSQADVGYVIDWLNCAKIHGLTIGYVGGWNEHGYNVAWIEQLRNALDQAGFNSVQIMAADSFPGPHYHPARTWNVTTTATNDPVFRAALGAIGSHDTCGAPTNGFKCESTPTARHLGLPLWLSELGALKGAGAPESLARAINNSYIQADITGIVQWPVVAAMPPGLQYSDRGLITAMQPQSGFYYVDPVTWVTAQTTQFAQPGWSYVLGASGKLGDSGSYVTYESPDKTDWSMVIQNAGGSKSQTKVGPQTIVMHLAGGLKASDIAVWSTNLSSANPSQWFVKRADVQPSGSGHTFSYTIKPGYLVTFTSTTGQSKLTNPPVRFVPMTMPYVAAPDASNEAWGLASQEGSFLYEPCLGGTAGQCIEQLTPQQPVFWQVPARGVPTPYAVAGALDWQNYTVSSSVLFTTADGSAGLIGRFNDQYVDPKLFAGYEFDVSASGIWRLLINTKAGPQIMAHGTVAGAGIVLDDWYQLALTFNGDQISASINGTTVASVTSAIYPAGEAGIESDYTPVQFNGLTVQPAG